MPRNSDERLVRILRIAGWGLGIFGLLLLGDDFVGPNQHDNFAGVLFVTAGIVTLVIARTRESRGRRHAESADPSSTEDDGDSPENSA